MTTSITAKNEKSANTLFMTFVRFRELSIIIIIVLLMILVSIRTPAFLTIDNFRDILLNISILVIVALAQTMVIVTRGIDLSVGSTIGLVAMMVAFVVVSFPGMSPLVAVALGMALGALLGSFNGFLITTGGVPPIIATLGTLSIYRGLIFVYSQGQWVNSYEMPESFRALAKGTPLGIPNIILIAALVAVIIYIFLNYTRPGRDIYTIGSNPDAARVAGINVTRTTFMVYVVSGLLCGLAAVLWASRFESAQTNTALGFELQSVAASVVGGVSIMGGSGTVLGVILGAFLLGTIENSLTLVRISPFWQLAAQGLLILVAVIIDSAIMRRLQRVGSKS
ncbi:MAG: ABC transporter permease [Anaerolineae bacterium]|nr:ABC transporter permease [Anaerolineae bacterium]MCO5191300.1 ABC transporter permease [Anaerolineae bacterium]MCO5196070.1 ABC transporter permease [Anaerolineae bacterium]MCO5208028.1 ABC transporter permease [Anaerolineae bacterium]